MKYQINVCQNNKVVQRVNPRNKRRFLKKARLINFNYGGMKIYVKVGYGKHTDVYKKYVDFHNDGYYENKSDLLLAVKAFIEEIKI